MKRLFQKGFTILELLIILALIATAVMTAHTVNAKYQDLVSKHPTHMTR